MQCGASAPGLRRLRARETPRIAAVDNRGDMNELQVYIVETASMARASFRINRVSSKPAMRSAAYNI